MASNYPGSLDSFDTIASDKKTSDAVGGRTHRQMHNDLGDAIEAVQAELGSNPSGPYDTVEARLVALSAGATLPDPDAKGDIFVATSANDLDNLSVGADGTVLLADSTETTGVTWGHGTKIDVDQPAENSVVEVVEVTPVTADAGPMSLRVNSFENTGDGAGTYNHGAWLGFNAGRHAGGDVVSAAPGSFIGLEDNYFDHVGDLLSGQEFYWEVHPDGAAVSPLFRPLYARASVSADGTTVNRAAVVVDTGTSGQGQFTVRKGASSTLVNVTHTLSTFYNSVNVTGASFNVQPVTGAAYCIIDGDPTAYILLRVDGGEKFAITATASSLAVYDGINAKDIVAIVPASTVAATSVDISGKVIARGGLSAGSGTSAPTLAATANLGTSPPTPTVSGNAARGEVSFGSGSGSTSAGAVIGVTLPSGTYGSQPVVTVSALNYATAQKVPYVTVYSATYFEIALASAAAVSQPAGTYKVAYQVMG